jgi:hypothetical protein
MLATLMYLARCQAERLPCTMLAHAEVRGAFVRGRREVP